ncbi:hypothetical protein [Desulforamulus reducens]|uniref:hypothetical protein n=1 Tax=Desulforamulus reducens TaxID=59610 RepID=UPI0002F0B0EE|nr:hypothetical protein [Desulforamulus reducens]
MKRAFFIGKAGEFVLFLRSMNQFLRIRTRCTHWWESGRSYGMAQVEPDDFKREAV